MDLATVMIATWLNDEEEDLDGEAERRVAGQVQDLMDGLYGQENAARQRANALIIFSKRGRPKVNCYSAHKALLQLLLQVRTIKFDLGLTERLSHHHANPISHRSTLTHMHPPPKCDVLYPIDSPA